MRREFAKELHKQMSSNDNIYVLVGDVGFGMFDKIKTDFPNRFINTGASEQAMMGIAVGLALEGKIPVVYTITPFLLYRAFETIRTYIDRENIAVKMIGAGRDKDYAHDGFSHWAEDDKSVMSLFKNIITIYPQDKDEISGIVDIMLKTKSPYYINLKR